MTKELLIDRTISYLKVLPDNKVEEVADFAEYLYQKYEDYILNKGIQALVTQSRSFDFLKDEEDLYTLEDLKERYK